ncbi:MAG: exosome complex exonuclease Rrp41 [Candidatus Aenigmarchaeota archaeon]|nr:exosome complex exonuclease Rrp41 [Candidatus Aenigmarchaeota archaeon]
MGSKVGAPEKFIIKGKRLDGRKLDEFRPMSADVHTLSKAPGSGEFSFENTKAISGVFGPKPFYPRGLQDPKRTKLNCKYTMIPFSTKERIRPGRSRRSTEISKVIREALAQVIFTEDYPKTGIDIFIDILQADASTRCAGLNAASLAIVDAGVPMADLISSCSVGKAGGEILLDVGGLEDNYGEVDFAVATVGKQDKFVLLQLDGIVTFDEFKKMVKMSKEGCGKVYEIQQEALRQRYKTGDNNENGKSK